MERRNKLRELIGILKDKASLIRATLLFTCSTSASASASSSSRLAVLRATSHHAYAPPHDHLVASVLAIGRANRLAAGACVDALMDRLHGTRNASVALKCLIVLHGVAAVPDGATSSSPSFLRDQLAAVPSSGGHNFLNLSSFCDDFNQDLSPWVRWFAGVLEQNLIASRVSGKFTADKIITGKSNSELLKEIDSLGNMVQQVSDAPESLHLQRNNLVHEVVMLAGQDYGLAQREIALRVNRLGDRIDDLSPGDSAELIRATKRLEDYRERLGLLLVNRKRNDLFWDLIGGIKAELARRQKEREERRNVVVAVGRRDESSDWTRYGARVAGRPEQLYRFPTGGGSGSSWLNNDRMALTLRAVG